MKRICLACLLLIVLGGFSLAKTTPTPGKLTLTVTVAPEKTPGPAPTPGREAALRSDPFTATLTPEATFVPLPTGTPFTGEKTPTPAPPTASPYPSPKELIFLLPDSVLTGAAREDEILLRAQPSENASRRGTLKKDETVRIAEESGDWYRIESGSKAGWAQKAAFTVCETVLGEAEHTVIRAGSLNIHSCRNRENLLVIADAIAMKNLDVIGLQEVSRSDKRDWLQRLAEAADYPYYYFSRTLSRGEEEYGIALMSRYPILFSETFSLDGYAGDEPRVLQYAVILTESGVVHFLNTHLSAKEMYIKSVNLASMVYTVRGLGRKSLFVTGDFNCGPPRLAEFWSDVSFANMTVNTFGDGSVPKILDNILYSGQIRVIDTEYTPLREATDHSLVSAELIYE